MNESNTGRCIEYLVGYRITRILTDYLSPKTSWALTGVMIRENRQLVTDQPVEFAK